MKIRSLLILAVMALVAGGFQSCKSDQSADATDLLKTVPSDASLVAVANVESLLTKAGCEVDGSDIKPGKAISAIIPTITDQRFQKLCNAFYNGESGIDPSVALVFAEGYYTYVTGLVSDPAKFRKIVEENYSAKFEQHDGVETASCVALADNRFWINMNQGSVDPQAIKHFLSLGEDQSFLANSYADNLVKIEKDIMGWGSIAGVLNTANVGFQERATFQVALQMLFEDVTNFTFDVDFDKGEAETSVSLINSKGKMAKYLFPTEKLDLETIKKVKGSAAFLLAFSAPAKLVEQIKEDASQKGPSMLGVFIQAFSPVDGTIAWAASEDGDSMSGVVATTGENTADLSSLLSETGATVNKDGKYLLFSKGAMTGADNVADMADDLKGAMAGMVVGNSIFSKPGRDLGINRVVIRFVPEHSGVEMKINVIGKDKNKNILLSILESAK